MTVSNLVRVCWSFTPDTLRVMSHHTGIKFISRMVPGAGLEPALPFGNQILSLERLPFRHPGQGQISSGEIGRTVSSWRASLARPAISGHGLLFWNESRLTWAGRPCHVARASRPWDRATARQNKRPGISGDEGPSPMSLGGSSRFGLPSPPSARCREFPRGGAIPDIAW